MLPLLFMLIWFVSPTFITQGDTTTNSPCVAKFLNSNCGATASDYSPCCVEISKATKIGQVCTCNNLNSDLSFLDQSMAYCNAYVDSIIESCQGFPVGSSAPPSDTSSPPDTTSDIFSPPSDTTSNDTSSRSSGSSPSSSGGSASGTKSGISVTAIVVPIFIVVVFIIVGVSIFFFCKRQRQMKPNAQNYPHNYPYNYPHNYPPNAYPTEVRIDQVLPSHSVAVDLPPLASTTPTSVLSRPVSSPVRNNNNFKSDDSLQFQLATLLIATNNFSEDNKIGRGGFGFVYKGILPDGRKIAVKRLSRGSGQGITEFQAEIELLVKLQHRNLVQLLGFCLEGTESLLMYELVPNKSLDYFLFDDIKKRELNWPIRFEIIKGIARGMLYLHRDSPLITIHRDVKSGNVLLDEKMNPKIADFGLARISDLEQTHINATRVIIGTNVCLPAQSLRGASQQFTNYRAYMSPEYLHNGEYSIKSDVYAFGVLMLEIISGRRPGSGSGHKSGELNEDLLRRAWRCWREEKPLELMDPVLKDSFSSDEVVKCIHLGLLCVQDDVIRRPDMSIVIHKLDANPDVAALAMPLFPGFFYNTSSDQSTSSMTTRSTTGSSSAVRSSTHRTPGSSGTVSSSNWSDYKNSR